MKLTKREIWALHTLLDFYIARYLMANTKGREDGIEKSEQHWKISNILAEFVLATSANAKTRTASISIHNYLANILTDRMDEVIFFPLDKPLYGTEYDQFKEAFFDVLVKHMADIERVAKETIFAKD